MELVISSTLFEVVIITLSQNCILEFTQTQTVLVLGNPVAGVNVGKVICCKTID